MTDAVTPGAVLLRRVMADPAKAVTGLRGVAPATGTVDEFIRRVSADPGMLGLKPSVTRLRADEWTTLHQYVRIPSGRSPGLFHPPPGNGESDTAAAAGVIVEKLGDTIPLDVELMMSRATSRRCRVMDKRTIVTFVYFRCTSICSPLLTELSRMIDQMDLEIGKDYQVVTCTSFDHHESRPWARRKRQAISAS